MPGPMDGVRVVELGVWVAGPAAGGVLADWGADVVKIEPLDGDPARLFSRMFGTDMPTNAPFEMDNRAERSIALDIGSEEGVEIALELVDAADVFVTNVRPGALERAGLDYDTLSARNPRLVYGHISGYGVEGPDADRAAYDIAAYWACSGIAHLLTPPGADPPFQRGGMGDHPTGQGLAGAIAAALFSRERSGHGQLVTTSLLRQGAYTISFDLNMALMWGLTPGVGIRTSMGNPAINNYSAGDGRRFWIVGLEADRHWPPLARVVGRPEWIDDERFADPVSRATNAETLIAELDAIFATRTLDEWADMFAAEDDLFWAPVNSPDDLLASAQFHASGAIVEVPDGSTGTNMIASPADFGADSCSPRFVAPALGEHTDEILAELGHGEATIERLRAAGAVA